MIQAILFLGSVVFTSTNSVQKVSSQIAVPQFLLVLTSSFLMGQGRDQTATLIILLSLALGAIGVWHRLVYGPDKQSFRQYGMGRFLIGGLGCVFFSALFLVVGIALSSWQILSTAGGAWWFNETRETWKERWLLSGVLLASSLICIPAIFYFPWREELSAFGD